MSLEQQVKRIAIHPGVVVSENDGQMHLVSARRLADLYGVELSECEVWDDERPQTYLGKNPHDYWHLYPLYSGKYNEVAAVLRAQLHDPQNGNCRRVL